MTSITNQIPIKQFLNSTELPAGTTLVDQSSSDDPVKEQKASTKNSVQPWWMSSLGPFIHLYKATQQRRKERHTCKYLMSLDDCFLKDIGINRADVVRAMQSKYSPQGASAELERIACETRAVQIQLKKDSRGSSANASRI